MLQRQQYQQTELFTPAESQNFRVPAGKPFLLRIRGYEKALLFVMVFVLTGIVSYSVGVEKGKSVPLINKGYGQRAYTIQVASFKNKELALQHAESLTSRSLSPLIFSKGNYIILCVGKFFDEESAQPLLLQLQKTYTGSRIRRL